MFTSKAGYMIIDDDLNFETNEVAVNETWECVAFIDLGLATFPFGVISGERFLNRRLDVDMETIHCNIGFIHTKVS